MVQSANFTLPAAKQIIKATNRTNTERYNRTRPRGAQKSVSNGYNGYFKVIQTDTNKLKVINGLNEEDTNCGYVQCNKLDAQAVSVQELTITENCYIFRKSVGSFTADVLTSATITFEILTSFPTYTAGTEYELLSVVNFSSSSITAFSNMYLSYRVDITGDCDI